MSTSRMTQKQKARRIVLQPNNIAPSGQNSVLAHHQKFVANSSLFKPSQEGAHLSQLARIGYASGCDKQSQQSKSQLAVKRQRSALWITRAHLLNKNNLGIQSKKASQNQSVQNYPHDMISPKAGSKPSMRAIHQLSQQRVTQNNSPGSVAQSKLKKQSLQQVRLSVEKFLKKRVGEHLAIFAKAGVPIHNQSLPIASAKVGEVFSSLVKNSKSRAGSHMEITNLLKASTTQSKGHTKSKKKHSVGLSTKQILTSMGLSSNPIQGNAPAPGLTPNHQANKVALGNAKMSSNTVGRQTGKATVPPGKNPRRQSQSRLETFEVGYPIIFERKTYHLPVHKLKKRLRQQLAQHSLKSLQEAISRQQQQSRESRPATQQARPKNLQQHPSQSKSKSPIKKSNSRMSQRPRPISKRRNDNKSKKGGSLYDDLDIAGVSQSVAIDDGAFQSLDSANAPQNQQENLGFNQQCAQPLESNLNHQTVTAKMDENTNALFRIENNLIEDQDQSGDEEKSEDKSSSEQSVADEVLDPVAAEAVIRELTKICVMEAVKDHQAQGSQEEEEEDEDLLSSHISHRSHDHIGYMPESLIQSDQDQISAEERKAFSEREVNLQGGVSEAVPNCQQWIEVSEKGDDDGEDEEREASAMLESLSDARLQDLQQQAKLTVPALKAQVMANLTKLVDTESSGFTKTQAKQTATNNKEELLNLPGDDEEVDLGVESLLLNTRKNKLSLEVQNKDVTVSPEIRGSSLQAPNSDLHGTHMNESETVFDHSEAQQQQLQLGAHWPQSVNPLVKPNSPSILSDDDQESAAPPETGVVGALNGDLDDHAEVAEELGAADDHLSAEHLLRRDE